MAKILMGGSGPDVSDEQMKAEDDLFRRNLRLIVSHSQEIFKKKEYFFCQPAPAFLSLAYFEGGDIPLGVLLLLWRDGKLLDKCQACGGTVHIIGVGGSSLSGSNKWLGYCIKCGEKQRRSHANFYELWKPICILLSMFPNKPIIKRGEQPKFTVKDGLVGRETPDEVIKPKIEGVSLAELVRILGGN